MFELEKILASNPASYQGNDVSRASMLAKIRAYASAYSTLPQGCSVILWHSDTLEFGLRLLALAQHNIDVVIPPNSQTQTLQDIAALTPFYAGEALADLPQMLQQVEQCDPCPVFDAELNWPSASTHSGNLIFFTSGSTGPSKAISKSWRAINLELATLDQTFPATSDTEFVAMVSHQHIYGLLFKLLWPLRFGHHFEVMSYQYPEHLRARIEGVKHCFIIASPAQLSRLAQDNVLMSEKARIGRVFSSGGPLKDTDAITLYEQLNVAVTQVYGSTETGGIGYRQVANNDITPWQPFAGVSLTQGSSTLVLRSPLLEEPMRVLDDTGNVLSNGQFILLGRADRTVKVAEKRVNLMGMEQRLNAHHYVAHCAVIQLPTGRLGALVQLAPGVDKSIPTKQLSEALKQWLLHEFESVCIPRKWRYLDELPYTPQGKLLLKELEQYFV